MSGLNLDTLNCVYFALFFVGVGYALFIVLTGGISDIDMPDVNIDVPQIDLPGDVDIPGAEISITGAEAAGGIDAPDVTPSPLSPITIASFVTVFGGVGVLCIQLFNTTPVVSLIAATASGLAASGLMYVFYSQVLIRSQGSSELHARELIGRHAEVTVPIGENVMGQVTYETKSGRMNSMARSVDGRPIPRGQFVQIVRVIGSQVLVLPLASDQGEKATQEGSP
jgi:membrane protein implicated in regulation of membrane protease activity